MHLQSYSQTLLLIPSAVTILKSLSFLGSAGQICSLLSCGNNRSLLSYRHLCTMLLHHGRPFCGWPPWKHSLRRQSWIAHGPGSIGDLRLGLLCSVSSIYTFCLFSVIKCDEIIWPLSLLLICLFLWDYPFFSLSSSFFFFFKD